MKIQNTFAIIVLALVAFVAGCDQSQEQRQNRHEAFARALEIRSLHLVEDLTKAESNDPLSLVRYSPLTGYAKDDRGNCFYVTTSRSRDTYEILALATVPCESLAPKK